MAGRDRKRGPLRERRRCVRRKRRRREATELIGTELLGSIRVVEVELRERDVALDGPTIAVRRMQFRKSARRR